jgi:hypothetical protein
MARKCQRSPACWQLTPVGWPSFYTEDYVNQAQALQTQLTSLVGEGVFNKFPDLRVVLIESGVSWLPAHLWRLSKFWRGLRMEVPWVDRPPNEIVRDQVRLTLQLIDAPPQREQLERLMDHIGSDRLLLFSVDAERFPAESLDHGPLRARRHGGRRDRGRANEIRPRYSRCKSNMISNGATQTLNKALLWSRPSRLGPGFAASHRFGGRAL